MRVKWLVCKLSYYYFPPCLLKFNSTRQTLGGALHQMNDQVRIWLLYRFKPLTPRKKNTWFAPWHIAVHLWSLRLALDFRVFFALFCFFGVLLFRAAPVAYGRSQARGQIGAVAADPHHSHSHVGSEPHL